MDFRDVWSRSTPSDKPSRREDEKEVRKPPTVSLVAREPSEMAIEVASINLSTGSIAHMHVCINKWHFKALNTNISVPMPTKIGMRGFFHSGRAGAGGGIAG